MINRFSKRNAFLSNFFPSPIVVQRHEYPTVEHAYQAAKCPTHAEQIRLAATAAEAKRLGRALPMRESWKDDVVKVAIMRDLLARKFALGAPLTALLLDTGDEELVEGNTWGDQFWGVDGIGENWLGRLLMERRRYLYDSGE